MKVLMISTDSRIIEPMSEARRRMLDYASLFERLEILVLARRGQEIKPVFLSLNCQAYPLSGIFRFWSAWRLGKKLIGKNKDWVIAAQDPFEIGLVGWLISRGTGARLNLQIHTDFLSPYFGRESVKNKIRVLLAKLLLPKADCVRAVSIRIKKSLADWPLKNDPVVLPIFVTVSSPTGGIDLHKKYPQFKFISLMASRLTQEKDFLLALQAFSLSQPEQAGLVIVGEGSARIEIDSKIKELGLSDRVIVEDWADRLSDYYRTADLFVLTSNYEGYGRTLVEATLSGCPVLTSDVGIVGEVFNSENSFICPVGDMACFSREWNRAIGNPSLRTLKQDKARESVASHLLKDKSEYLKKYRESFISCQVEK